MINDIFDEIIECCLKVSNCGRCPFWDNKYDRCLFEGNPSFWDMDVIRDAFQKMREDKVKELKQNNKTKYEKECTPLDINKAKELRGCVVREKEQITEPVIRVPQNATNGDIIKALFPDSPRVYEIIRHNFSTWWRTDFRGDVDD